MQFDSQIIVRFPEHVAKHVTVDTAIAITPISYLGEESFRIFEVQLDSALYYGVLLDLPCIIESQKTLDWINYFKSSDICQMLLIIDSLQSLRERGGLLSRVLIKGEKYRAKSGISPGMRNITSRFFRREIIENLEEVRSVELLLKNVMEFGTSKNVEEQLVEFDFDSPIPEPVEQTYFLENCKDDPYE